MANTKSAVKRHRQSLKRRSRNQHWRTKIKNIVKKARETVKTQDPTLMAEALRVAEKTLRKAASKGVIHARTASRRVSRLGKALAAPAK